jgi:MFS family permease
MASVGNEFYVVTLLLQQAHGYGPIAAGLAFLPMTLAITAGNALAGRLVTQLGVRRLLTTAFVVDAVGLLLLAWSGGGDSYLMSLLPGLLISGIGHGMTYTSMFIAGTAEIDGQHQGTGSALMTTSQYVSGAIGIAILVLVLGPAPGDGRFGWAFVVTAAAAVTGAVLAWFGLVGSRSRAGLAQRV